MVRTADSSLRVTGGKATRKGTNVNVRPDAGLNISPSGSSSEKGTGGLNPVVHWATPKWQKSITEFFKNKLVEKKKVEIPLESEGESTSIPSGSQTIEEVLNHSDKENVEPPSLSSLTMDVEMCEETRTSKRTAEDDPMECIMAPRKKIKLNKNIAMHLEEMEKC